MRRCSIYRRVSRATETNLTGSMEDQLAACQVRAASEDGWRLIPDFDYAEAGKSAFNERPEKRPVFQQLLADAQRGCFDVVLVYKFDRFSRRNRHFLNALADLHDAGVEVVSVTEPSDYGTAGGRFAVRNMANVSELFSDMLAERMTVRRKAEAVSGRHIGPVPIGYQLVGKGQLAPSAQAELVRRMFALAAPGTNSSAEIAFTLNTAGWTTTNGHALTNSFVLRVLRNKTYIGLVPHQGQWYPGKHEPIIDRDLWDTVQAMLERRKKNQPERMISRAPYALLPGLVFCANCGSKMHYCRGNRNTYYVCKTVKLGTGSCNAPCGVADALDRIVLDVMQTLALPQEWYEEALEIAEQILREPRATPDPAQIHEKLRRLGRAYADGAYSEAEYEQKQAELRAQLGAALPLPRTRIRLEAVARQLANLPVLLRDATTPEQRAILLPLIDQIYVQRDEVLAIRPTSLYAPMLQAAREHVYATQHLQVSTPSSIIPVKIPLILPARVEVLR